MATGVTGRVHRSQHNLRFTIQFYDLAIFDKTINANATQCLCSQAVSGDWDLTAKVLSQRVDSTDVVRSTWLRLLENLRRIDDPELLPGWLAATARREARDLLRRRSSSGDHWPPAVHVVKGFSGQ